MKLHDLSLAEAAARIKGKELSPVELTEACLARIEELEPRLNAFITVTAETARAEAEAAADEIASGRYRGPLHGVPFAVKDLFDVAGVATTAGSAILADNVAREDSEAVARLRAAGAIILGKLNLHEFAYGATGANVFRGAARNPWDSSRITGGSSSGSGAAVAAGECIASLGTDTGGSIRIPASLCGIVGLKPTFGRVSRRGVVPLAWSLDHVGPMTRTVEDAALVLQAIAGYDPRDGSSSTEPLQDYTADLRGGVRRLRVGVPSAYFFDGVEEETSRAVSGAIDVLRGLGAEVMEVSLPLIDRAGAAVAALQVPEALAYHQEWMRSRPQDYGEMTRQRLEMGVLFPAVSYIQAQRFRELIVAEWREKVFPRVDVLAMPSTAITAPASEEGTLDTVFKLIRLTNPLNLLGIPAISVPCGFTAGGLPIGLQIAGAWFEEALVLRAAYAYEQAAGWHTRRPPL